MDKLDLTLGTNSKRSVFFANTVGPRTMDVRYMKREIAGLVYRMFQTPEPRITDKMSGVRGKNLVYRTFCQLYEVPVYEIPVYEAHFALYTGHFVRYTR